MNHDFQIHLDASEHAPFRRRLQPESVAIMGIVAAFWFFLLLRLIAAAMG